MGASWDGITREHFLLVIHDNDLWMQILLVLNNNGAHQAGRLIDVAFDRDTGDHIAEFDLATLVGENRHIVWIPLNEGFALLNRASVTFGDH